MNSEEKPQKVSILVLTRNEEAQIERCLSSAAWADEILVVDAMSSDHTREIAEAPGRAYSGKVRFVSRLWSGFRDQRNFALEQASNDWVFFLDADEAVSPELRERLTSLMKMPGGPPYRYYKVRRKEYFLGKPIEYGIWNPSYQDRFFHRSGVRYVNEVHEYPVFPQPPQSLHEPILHSPEFSIEKFLDKMNRYTSIEASDRFRQGQRTSAFKLVFAFPAMLYKNYFYYQAYRDGYHGFVISLLEGVSRVVRHMKMWQLEQRENRKK